MEPTPATGDAASPSLHGRVPPELSRFLAGPGAKTLTVRGPPGAGKTTFALALLDQFEGYRAYISARVPRESIVRDHPWLAGFGRHGIEVIELLRFRGGAAAGLQVGRLRDALEDRASDLVDLSTILSLPKELEESLASHAAEPRFVTIDSWEAWVENLLGPTPFALDVPTTRWELERSLLDRFREAGVHVLLVVEREERARLDYVTDGALSLTVSEADGRAQRWLSYQKLRGVRLGSISYPFTLDGGRFQCVLPAPFHARIAPIPDEPDPGPGTPGIWPGSTSLAVRFGRLAVPGATLLEADSETPARLLWRLVVPAILSSLRAGGRVVVRPPSSLSNGEVWESMGAAGDATALSRSLRVLTSAPPGPTPGIPDGVFGAGPGEDPEAGRPTVADLAASRFFEDATASPPRSLLVLFLDSPFDPPGSPGTLESLLGLAGAAHRSEVVANVFVSRTDHPSIEAIRARSAVHLLVRASRGQFFVTGVRPWTPHFVIGRAPAARETTVPYELVPIV